MRQHKWLNGVKEYECEIMYHTGKPNVVVDTLSHKMTSIPFQDLFLRMIIMTPLLDMIKGA